MLQETEIIKKITDITTISGKKAQRKNCVRIREKYHEKNVDCVRINEKWVSIHFNKVAVDAATNTYNFVSKLKPCVLEYRDETHVAYGMTTEPYGEPFNLFNEPDGNLFYAVNKAFYDSLNISRCKVSGNNYPFGKSPYTKLKATYKKGESDWKDLALTAKGAREKGLTTPEMMAMGVISKHFVKSQGMEYTFGVEIETSGGLIPKAVAQDNLNINYLYDGSVYSNSGKQYGGGEIITGVLTGDSGLAHLEKICKEITDRCDINPTCGVHVHIGNLNFSNEFLVNAYMLSYIIQEDLFRYMPKKRSFQVDYKGNIQGDNVYCKKMPAIDLYDFNCATKKEFNLSILENYKRIFKWVSGGVSLSDRCNKKLQHPKGNKCGYDHSSARYHWLNLVPAMFNTRGDGSHTIEFRSMGETTNYYKIYYWLLLCFAFVKVCENKTNCIIDGVFTTKDGIKDEINVLNLISNVYTGELRDELLTYYKAREKFFNLNKDALEMNFNYKK